MEGVNYYKSITVPIAGISYRQLVEISTGELKPLTVDVIGYIPRCPVDLAELAKQYMCQPQFYPRDYMTDKTARMGLAARLKRECSDISEPKFNNEMDAAVYGLIKKTKLDNDYYMFGSMRVYYMYVDYDGVDDMYYIYYIAKER